MRRLAVTAGALTGTLFLGVLVVWPLATILSKNLADVGWSELNQILGRSSTRGVVWFTLWQALVSALATLIVGLPIAHGLARHQFRGRAVVRALAVVPFVLPTVVVAAAFDALFDRVGADPTGTVLAIVMAHVFFNIAVVVRIVGGFWSNLDRRGEDAARVLGATPWQAFRLITLPRLIPVIGGAGLLTFLFSFTSFGVILILGGPRRATLETEIYRYAVFRQEFDVAAVLALVQIAVVALAAAGSAWVQRNQIAAKGQGRPIAVKGLRPRLNVALVLGLVLVVMVAPLAAMFERSLHTGDGYSFRYYSDLLDPISLLPVTPARALLTSLMFAAMAAVVASIVGLASAIAITRGGLVGKFLEAAALVPLGVSAVTLGFGYLVTFTVFDLRRSIWLIPLAHAVIGLPFVLASVVPAMRAIDDRLRQAASTLGASPLMVTRQVDWPLIRRPLFTGAGFAAAISVGEFGATSFLARGAASFTAPLAIFRLLSQPGDLIRGQALALSVVVGVLVAIIAALLEWQRGNRGGLL